MDMGIGKLGNPKLTIKRKYRWTLEVQPYCGGNHNVPPFFVRMAGRPNFQVEERELNFLNSKMWIAGKPSWQTITVTYIDTATVDNQQLYTWLATIYNFTDPTNAKQGSSLQDYGANVIITEYNGCGDALAAWTLGNAFPTGVNFGDLDFTSSEECTVELTLRYGNVKYQSFCPGFTVTPCCSPCTPNI